MKAFPDDNSAGDVAASEATAAFPKLRTDLTVSRQLEAGAVIYVVKDPVSRRYFRFKEVEGFLLQNLNGTMSLDDLRQRVSEEFEAPLRTEVLQRFLDRLRGLGLLETKDSESCSSTKRASRFQGDIFYLRFKAFDPDRLLEVLARQLRFCFTPWFVAGSALAVVVAAGITVGHWAEIKHDFFSALHLESLLVAWVTVIAVIILHEFAHGVTCKRFGGNVHELGFLLLYFQPTMYCNISDSWMFTDKSKRLWVTFAGAYFELALWAAATIVWRVIDPGSFVSWLALIVVITSGVKTLFNFNPLIKLDGYYLLSDWLEIPNLRGKSFAYLGDQFRKLTGSANRKVADATSRERRIFLLYSILAATYSYWLFAYALSYMARFLVNRYQAWGFVAFAVMLGVMFRRPLTKNIGVMANRLGYDGHVISRTTKRIVWLVILTLGGVSLFVFNMELKVSGPFTILPIHNADIRAEVEGIIEEVFVDEGAMVKKGDLLARLSDRDYRAELRKVASEIDEKEAQLKLLLAGPRTEEIELAKTLVTKAEERIKYAARRVEMDGKLFADKLVSQRDYEDSKEILVVRQKELQEAQDRLRVLLAGSREEEIEANQAEIRRLKAQRAYFEEQLTSLDIISPIAGVVATHKLKETVGQNVKKGDLIAAVHELDTVTAEIAVPEKEIADVQIGQKVMLKARAFPASSFQGTVTAIAPVAAKQDEWRNDRAVLVTTRLDNSTGLLKSEMSGNAKIYCGKQRLYNLVTRRFVRFLRVEMWSWW